MADPMALVVADAAARAVEFVGLPEAQLNLAQAVVHLATAPKSNRSRRRRLAGPRATCATGAAARCRPTCATPTTGGRALGHGKGYDYPHDDPRGWVAPGVPAREAATPLLRAVAPRPRAGDRRPHATDSARRATEPTEAGRTT